MIKKKDNQKLFPTIRTPQKKKEKNSIKSDLENEAKFIKTNAPQAIGKKEMVSFLKGKKLTYKEMILAKCFDCNCYYGSKKTKDTENKMRDCNVTTCPLYSEMPYSKINTKIKRKTHAS